MQEKKKQPFYVLASYRMFPLVRAWPIQYGVIIAPPTFLPIQYTNVISQFFIANYFL